MSDAGLVMTFAGMGLGFVIAATVSMYKRDCAHIANTLKRASVLMRFTSPKNVVYGMLKDDLDHLSKLQKSWLLCDQMDIHKIEARFEVYERLIQPHPDTKKD